MNNFNMNNFALLIKFAIYYIIYYILYYNYYLIFIIPSRFSAFTLHYIYIYIYMLMIIKIKYLYQLAIIISRDVSPCKKITYKILLHCILSKDSIITGK